MAVPGLVCCFTQCCGFRTKEVMQIKIEASSSSHDYNYLPIHYQVRQTKQSEVCQRDPMSTDAQCVSHNSIKQMKPNHHIRSYLPTNRHCQKKHVQRTLRRLIGTGTVSGSRVSSNHERRALVNRIRGRLVFQKVSHRRTEESGCRCFELVPTGINSNNPVMRVWMWLGLLLFPAADCGAGIS
jgi:hypothetical protein